MERHSALNKPSRKLALDGAVVLRVDAVDVEDGPGHGCALRLWNVMSTRARAWVMTVATSPSAPSPEPMAELLIRALQPGEQPGHHAEAVLVCSGPEHRPEFHAAADERVGLE